MNKIKFIAPFPLVIFLLLSIINSLFSNSIISAELLNHDTTEHDFKFEISTNKNIYSFGENIEITFRILNTGKKIDTISVTYFFPNSLAQRITCIRDEKDTVKWSGIEPDYFHDSYKILKPGEDYSVTDNLNDYFRGEHIIYSEYFRAGNYKAVCRYRIESPSTVFIRSAISNTIEFSVQPEPDSLVSIHILLSKLEKNLNFIKTGSGSVQEDIDSGMVYVRKYINLNFIDNLFLFCVQYRKQYNYKYDDSFITDIETFFAHKPESIDCEVLVWDCVDYYTKKNDKTVAREFLIRLKRQAGNTKLNRYIDQALGSYEKWGK